MKKLMDKKKFLLELDVLMNTTDETGTYTLKEFIEQGKEPTIRRDTLLEHVKDCTLSPAELGGDSWVLEKLKEKLCDDDWILDPYTCNLILEELNNLEFQAPVSELAE